MRQREAANAQRLTAGLETYENLAGPLPGIASPLHRAALIEQLIDSDRRNRYMRNLVDADLSPSRLDPTSGRFDPLKAAVLQKRAGSVDESFWMVFLFVHFGKHRTGGWRYASDVYGRLGATPPWDWREVSRDTAGFGKWMDENADAIRKGGPGGFGNHRKYESLVATGDVVASYVNWVGRSRSHSERIAEAEDGADSDTKRVFGKVFRSMAAVHRFGRVARFDYLSTVSKLGLAAIEPDRAHLEGATGPLTGARLLFEPPPGPPSEPIALDTRLVELERFLAIGMDGLEDALCNWQKSPAQFKPFRG